MGEGEVIYEINSSVPLNLATEYIEFLIPHIGEVKGSCDGFLSHEIFTHEGEDKNYKHYTVLFRLTDMPALENYLKNHAPRLRQQVLDRFGTDHGIKYSRRNLQKLHF